MKVYLVLRVTRLEGIQDIEGVFASPEGAIKKARQLVDEENQWADEARSLDDRGYADFPDPEYARQKSDEYHENIKYNQVTWDSIHGDRTIAIWADHSSNPGKPWLEEYHSIISVVEKEVSE
jgi:hypothetical protein